MLIDATHAEETRVVVVDGNKVEEFDFESENKRQLAGNIYLAKVTRVEPSLQAAFVDYGGNRHGFLAFSEIHPDYYQIPVADREALMAEERAYAESLSDDDEDEKPKGRRRGRGGKPAKAEKTRRAADPTVARDVSEGINGMETIDLDEGEDTAEGLSPMELVSETPVEEPEEDVAAVETDLEPGTGQDAAPAEDDVVETDHGTVEEVAADSDEGEDSIESVSDHDIEEEIRPPRKPRARRYKIQEVIKVRQILLVQVVKEERGNKGAALTTYLSLAGRYCVLMPNTARGGGISRKITVAADRKKLKEIATSIDVPQGAGLIIRTAGAKRTKTEIKRDYEYLQRLWEQIRELTLKSIAPAKIYEEGDLIKRSIRDLYNRDIDEVLVEGERGYRNAKDFMKMIMPSHAKNVQMYTDQMPLFARYQVESYLSSMFNPVVQLKSGGYIVIGVTEALVAIDVNSGRATKEGSIEETALKTNLEAADEVARQLRLRDLAGLIVIDFIDMDERKNNASVEKRLKDRLKSDRARIQVGRISGFGLLEMSRQRLRPGMIEATTQPCPHCHGTGLLRSNDNLSLAILRQIEEEGVRGRTKEVLLKVPVAIANYLMNQKREHVAGIEARYGLAVRIEGDPMLISPDYTIEKFKTATRVVAEVAAPVVSANASLMDQIDDEDLTEDDEEDADVSEAPEASADDDQKPKKRRRRRRRRGKSGDAGNGAEGDAAEQADDGDEAEASEAEAEAAPEDGEPKKRRRSRSRRRKSDKPAVADEGAEAEAVEAADDGAEDAETETSVETADAQPDAEADAPAVEAEEKPKPKRTRRKPAKKAEVVAPEAEAAPETTPAAEAEAEAEPIAPEVAEPAEPVAEAASPEPTQEPEAAEAPQEPEAVEPMQAPEPTAEAEPVAEPEPELATAEPDSPPKPKRRGWWSLGS